MDTTSSTAPAAPLRFPAPSTPRTFAVEFIGSAEDCAPARAEGSAKFWRGFKSVGAAYDKLCRDIWPGRDMEQKRRPGQTVIVCLSTDRVLAIITAEVGQ